jgi:peptide/nickel transport system substrate-binding protein
LRRALSLAIDRSGIANTVYGGLAKPMNSIVHPDGVGYAHDAFASWYATRPQATVDLDEARRLVQEAGAPTTPITIALPAGDPASLQVGNAIVSAGEEIGLNLKVRELPPNQFTALFFDPGARKGIDALVAQLYSDLFEPLEFFLLGAVPGPQDLNGYSNPVVTEAVTRGLAQDDDDRRAQAVITATEQFDKDLPLIPLVTVEERLFLNNRLSGAPSVFPYQYFPWAALVGAAG